MPLRLSLLLSLFVCSATLASDPKPNVILILADDLGAKELGCYGNKIHKTPNLDALAAEGTRFETFYANPLCTPTRVALMTGRYGFHTGYLGMSNKAFIPADDAPERKIANHFTNGKLMKSAGYATAQVGKWQLSGELPDLVYECGFDSYLMWAYDKNLPPGIKHPGREKKEDGTASRYWHPSLIENRQYRLTRPEEYGPDLHNQFALDFAKKNKDKPFFIYYTSCLTHGPHLETPDPNKPGARLPDGFQNNLQYLDHLIGQLVAGLKAEGLYDKTIIFLIGDNGTGGSGKSTVTELGARVPGIVRGPGVKAGQVSGAVADLTDVMATLADWSDAKLPADVKLDGYSLVPVLSGKQAKHRDWAYSHLDDGRLIRDERWLMQIDKGGSNKLTFFDCGTCRDGSTYKDVTNSSAPDVVAARARFDEILHSLPIPTPREGVAKGGRAEKKAERKAKKGKPTKK